MIVDDGANEKSPSVGYFLVGMDRQGSWDGWLWVCSAVFRWADPLSQINREGTKLVGGSR